MVSLTAAMVRRCLGRPDLVRGVWPHCKGPEGRNLGLILSKRPNAERSLNTVDEAQRRATISYSSDKSRILGWREATHLAISDAARHFDKSESLL